MKILLSYSKTHFDPLKSREEQDHWGSSASRLARTLYKELSTLGEITYIDSKDYGSVREESFDLFIGISNNFQKILSSCTIKKSILFAVNMHPVERNKRLATFMQKHSIPEKALAGYEFITDQSYADAAESADHIICVGNITTYNSYIAHGIPRHKIKIINYGMDNEVSVDISLTKTHIPRFLYCVSEIGLRKGFDIIADIFSTLHAKGTEFHLDIIGKCTTPHYEQKLESIQKTLGAKMTFHGWIKSDSIEYKQVLNSNDFIIHPAIEEGQAGTVLEAISQGLIPIISKETGVDFSPLGFITPEIGGGLNTSIIDYACALSETEKLDLQNKTLRYYNAYHSEWKHLLIKTIKDCIHDNLYPKMSIVLSIFNKEQTILSLVKHLTNSCASYPSVEYQIIFDGCRDNTEQIVRTFFSKHPNYEVQFHVTNNIWEVKSNNLGLRNASGAYTVIVQDDNFIYDDSFLYEAALFLEKNTQAVVLGGLAGVNFYPRGTILPSGPGQVCVNDEEVYWRQDTQTDPSLTDAIFQVDACMRGPLFFRKSFLEQHGYLDEIYAPLYNDDMDLCFRAAEKGYTVYGMLMNVENKNGTVAIYSPEKARFFQETVSKHADIFYSRWTPSSDKRNYLRINRTRILGTHSKAKYTHPLLMKYSRLMRRFLYICRRIGIFVHKSLKEEGFIRGIRKTLSQGFREFERQTPRLRYYSLLIAKKIYRTPKDIEDAIRESRERAWYRDNGDATLRLNYPLGPKSIVVDAGGYKGDWAADIHAMYNATVHVFEPIPEYAFNIRRRFKHNPKIIIRTEGLSNRDHESTIFVAEGGSSTIKPSSKEIKVKLIDAHGFLKDFEKIDLLKINIEGGEYELLERLIETGDIRRVTNIQIQFHDFVSDARNRADYIRKSLGKTHRLTYQYDFVWENWEQKQ